MIEPESESSSRMINITGIKEIEQTQSEIDTELSDNSGPSLEPEVIKTFKKRQRSDRFCLPKEVDLNLDNDLSEQLLSPTRDDVEFLPRNDDKLDKEFDDESEKDDYFLYKDKPESISEIDVDDDDDDDEGSDFNGTRTSNNYNETWILLWIFKYQERFRLPDVAINSLIKFFKKVLVDTDSHHFEGFPSSAYIARKLLGIRKIRKYIVCPECHKNYDLATTTLMGNYNYKCSHIEFPNHPMKSQHEPCSADLFNKVPVHSGLFGDRKWCFRCHA